LFSDHIISIAGRSIAITGQEMLVAVAVVACAFGVLFLATLYFSRRRVVVLKRSSGTDQVAFELSRIADALERIANRPAERAIAAATRRQLNAQAAAAPQRESEGVAYSIFGR
jgi:hypothetical protein